jgi:uncharacterized lipoprotein YajG
MVRARRGQKFVFFFTPEGDLPMKRLAAIAAVMLLAACAPRDEATIDTPASVPAMAPAPADTVHADTMHHEMPATETPAQP